RGCTARMPVTPSTMTSRVSAAVSATSAILRAWPPVSGVLPQTFDRTHSAPVRVLPHPRPARMSQVTHWPGGAICSGRAQRFQDHSSASASALLSVFRIFARSDSGSDASNSACDFVNGVYLDCLDWASIFARYLHALGEQPHGSAELLQRR